MKGTVHVSVVTEDIIADLEQEWCLYAIQAFQKGDSKQADQAYTTLQKCRRELYEHIADMERLLKRSRSVTKRF